jgi:hypothetical protein
MNIYKAYKYIFFKFYKWAEKLHGDKESHEFTAFFSLTFLVYANLASIFLALKLILNFSIAHIELSKLEIGIYSLMPTIPQYLLLLYRNKYLKILKEFGKEDKREALNGTIYAWLYIVITFVILFGLVFIQMKINQANA